MLPSRSGFCHPIPFRSFHITVTSPSQSQVEKHYNDFTALRDQLAKIDANVPKLPGKSLLGGDKASTTSSCGCHRHQKCAFFPAVQVNHERQAAFSSLLEYCGSSDKLRLCAPMCSFLNIKPGSGGPASAEATESMSNLTVAPAERSPSRRRASSWGAHALRPGRVPLHEIQPVETELAYCFANNLPPQCRMYAWLCAALGPSRRRRHGRTTHSRDCWGHRLPSLLQVPHLRLLNSQSRRPSSWPTTALHASLLPQHLLPRRNPSDRLPPTSSAPTPPTSGGRPSNNNEH